MSISKVLIAALAFGAINALPQPKASTPRAAPIDNTELIASILTAPTTIKGFRKVLTDGENLLSGDALTKATIFDFNNNPNAFPVPGSQGGLVTSSNLETFPILTKAGLAATLGIVGPCGLLAPHVHPRASEYFLTVDGEIEFGYTLEVGLLAQNPMITGTMSKYQATLFPQGSVHYQINNSKDCKPATGFVVLSSNDPGTTPFLFKSAKGNATVAPRQAGQSTIGGLRELLPESIVKIVDECLVRCNLVEV